MKPTIAFRPFSHCMRICGITTVICTLLSSIYENGFSDFGFVILVLILPFTFIPYNYLIIISLHYLRIIPFIFLSDSLTILEVLIITNIHFIVDPIIGSNIDMPILLGRIYTSFVGKFLLYLVLLPLLTMIIIRIIFNKKFNHRAEYYDSVIKQLGEKEKKIYENDLLHTLIFSVILIMAFISTMILLN